MGAESGFIREEQHIGNGNGWKVIGEYRTGKWPLIPEPFIARSKYLTASAGINYCKTK